MLKSLLGGRFFVLIFFLECRGAQIFFIYLFKARVFLEVFFRVDFETMQLVASESLENLKNCSFNENMLKISTNSFDI